MQRDGAQTLRHHRMPHGSTYGLQSFHTSPYSDSALQSAPQIWGADKLAEEEDGPQVGQQKAGNPHGLPSLRDELWGPHYFY